MPPKQMLSNRKYVKKSSVKKGKSKYSSRSLVNLIKQVNLKQSEVKYKTLSLTKTNIYHDTLDDFQLWDSSGTANIFPDQGTTDSSRIGDRIMVQGIRLRMVLQIPWDRRNANIKMWYVPFNNGQGSPTTYGEFFHNITGNSQLDPIQKKRWPSVVYLGNFYLRSKDRDSGATHTDATIFINKWLPLNKAVYFKADASNAPVNMKEYGRIIIAPYDTISSATTDIIITNLEASATLYFKDL